MSDSTTSNQQEFGSQEWLAKKRKSLAAQGAVAFFEGCDTNDQIAQKAIAGLAWGTPGSGLYKKGAASYEMWLHAGLLDNGEEYSLYSSDDWERLLVERDERLKYIDHHEASGFQTFHWRQIIVRFRVVDSGEAS